MHAHYDAVFFDTYVSAVNEWIGKPVCPPCKAALNSYLAAFYWELYYRSRLQNSLLECLDYMPSPLRDYHCNRATELAALVPAAAADTQYSEQQVAAVCQ